MPVGTGARVYEQWVRSSFEGWADWILVAEVDGRIAGYAVWKKASALEVKHSFDIAHCNLEAIHPDFFGRGLYTALTLEGMRIGGNFAQHFDLSTHVRQLSSASRHAKARLEDRRRKTFLSQMAPGLVHHAM